MFVPGSIPAIVRRVACESQCQVILRMMRSIAFLTPRVAISHFHPSVSLIAPPRRYLSMEAAVHPVAINAVDDEWSSKFPLPAPLEFQKRAIGEMDMMVAHDNFGETFFLDEDAHQAIIEYISRSSRLKFSAPAPLLLVGPVKSSKSTILCKIENMLTAKHLNDKKQGLQNRRPVILKVALSLLNTPEGAITTFQEYIDRMAHSLGIELPKVFSKPDAGAFHVVESFQMLADAAWSKNLCVWLFVDEVQAPLLNCELDASGNPGYAAQSYMYMWKELIENSYRHARFVATGSSVVAFLQSVRSLRPNGYSLWHSSKHVMLGRPLPSSTKLEIASIMLHHYQCDNPALNQFGARELLSVIESHPRFADLFTVRPAVLDVILASLPVHSQQLKIFDKLEFFVHQGIDDLKSKIITETYFDVARFLVQLQSFPIYLQKIFEIASGPSPVVADESDLKLPDSLNDFISLLCGIGRHSDIKPTTRQLLAPYSTLFRQLITAEGEFSVDMYKFAASLRLAPTPRFISTVNFFAEYREYLTDEQLQLINDSVLLGAADKGVGVLIEDSDSQVKPISTHAELYTSPLTCALRRHNLDEHSARRDISQAIRSGNFTLRSREESDFAKERRAVLDGSSKMLKIPPGIILLLDMRIFNAHEVQISEGFDFLGWQVSHLEWIARTASLALRQLDIPWLEFLPDGSPRVIQARFVQWRDSFGVERMKKANEEKKAKVSQVNKVIHANKALNSNQTKKSSKTNRKRPL